ncbi:MAG: hypothetical protein M3167_18155 [Acidobacteriota bacterium]|nr:hypothetical protein [Acidobacteriota bacterium]
MFTTMFTSTRRGAAAAVVALAAVLLMAARLEAQPTLRTLSERGYERIRAMSDDLDRAAQHAADAAQHSRSSFYGSDRDFQRAIANFARRAHGFNARMANYRARPWQVDDELAGLLADARSVEARVQQSRRQDRHVLEDWSRTVDLLNQMIDVYKEDLGRGGYRDRRPHDHDGVPDGTHRDEPGRTEGPAYRDDQGYRGGRSSVAGLVSDVSDRANRLAQRARQLAGPIPADERQRNAWQAIQKLAQDASALGVRIDREGQVRDLRPAVAELNAEAAEADRQMRAGNVFPELKSQWADLMQSIQRLREAAGA